MPERLPSDPSREQLATRVSAAIVRHRERLRTRRSPWHGLGLFGIVGWSITIPTLVGIAIGVAVDRRAPGTISWTLAGLAAGMTLGIINAAYWVSRESTREDP